MKKYSLLFALFIWSIIGFAQTRPVSTITVANATTAFGQNISIGTKIENLATSECWKADSSVISTATLTSKANCFSPDTKVTGTLPIVSTGTPNPVISINPATTTTPGSLSAVDKVRIDSIPLKEIKANKVTSITYSSTDYQYPSAKLLYDQLQLLTVKNDSSKYYARKATTITTTAPITIDGTTSANLSANRTIAIIPATTSVPGSMSAADKTKLDGIATGATANTGTVTSVTGGTGITGGTITTTGTLAIDTTIVAKKTTVAAMYEPKFAKNTGFNKAFGFTSGTVLEGRTFGTAANSATGDFAPATGGSYLPLSGGALTGLLEIRSANGIQFRPPANDYDFRVNVGGTGVNSYWYVANGASPTTPILSSDRYGNFTVAGTTGLSDNLTITKDGSNEIHLINTNASGKNWKLNSYLDGTFYIGQDAVVNAIAFSPVTGNAVFSGSGYFASSVTANSFVKIGGTSAQYLLADGSVTSVAGAVYKGQVNGTTGSGLADGTGTAGWYYACSTAGSYNYGSGSITLAVGDQLYYNGTIWLKIPGAGSYTLPIATASVLGGVKSSASVAIDGSGVASVSTAYDATGTASGLLSTHAALTTTAHGLGASAFHTDSYFLTPTGSAAGLTSFPTLNQNTTGTAGSTNVWTRYTDGDGTSTTQVWLMGYDAFDSKWKPISAAVANAWLGTATSTHVHGNITNTGYLGTTASIPLITGTSGIIQAGAFGSTSGTFAQGNDSRFTDARVSNIAAGTEGNFMISNGSVWTSGLPDVAAGRPLLSGGVTYAPAYAGYTFTGTTAKTYTFPTTTATLARTDAAQTFTGVQTFSTPIATASVATMTGTVGGGVPVSHNLTTEFLNGQGVWTTPIGGTFIFHEFTESGGVTGKNNDIIQTPKNPTSGIIVCLNGYALPSSQYTVSTHFVQITIPVYQYDAVKISFTY